MRALLASAVGVACMTALAVPLTSATISATMPSGTSSGTSPGIPSAGPPSAGRGGAGRDGGGTWTLPLAPVARSAVRAVDAPAVKPFSLLGVTWDNAATEFDGTVQVRTRSARTGAWSAWQDVEVHTDDTPDAGSPEESAPGVRGATAPLWVGPSDGVQARVRPGAVRAGAHRLGIVPAVVVRTPLLPAGLRLDMVDPGDGPDAGGYDDGYDDGYDGHFYDDDDLTGDLAPADQPSDEEPVEAADPPVLPPVSKEQEAAETGRGPYIGARPRIITRSGWGADEKLRERKFVYTKTVKVAFVHHSATGNNYSCDEAASVIRSIYRYHVKSSNWRDIGYNFLVDKCGNIYEGRAGGVTKAVYGAHTLGFNSNSMGIAVIGTYSTEQPTEAALRAVSQLSAWKLGLFGRNPEGTATLLSGGSNKFRKGVKVKFKVISGHRDGFRTECPGERLYDDLGEARSSAADMQGR